MCQNRNHQIFIKTGSQKAGVFLVTMDSIEVFPILIHKWIKKLFYPLVNKEIL